MGRIRIKTINELQVPHLSPELVIHFGFIAYLPTNGHVFIETTTVHQLIGERCSVRSLVLVMLINWCMMMSIECTLCLVAIRAEKEKRKKEKKMKLDLEISGSYILSDLIEKKSFEDVV